MWITDKPWLKNETCGGTSLWMVLLHLSQIESRRIKGNFASPESTITQPEASWRTLFVLNVTDCFMHELDSLVICAPINLKYSFTVIMIIIILMDEQRDLSFSRRTLCQKSFFHLGPKLHGLVVSRVILPVCPFFLFLFLFFFFFFCLCVWFFWFCCSFWLFELPFSLALLHYWVSPGFGQML